VSKREEGTHPKEDGITTGRPSEETAGQGGKGQQFSAIGGNFPYEKRKMDF